MATEAALPAPAGDLGVLLAGRLLLLPSPVRQPAEARRETQTAVTACFPLSGAKMAAAALLPLPVQETQYPGYESGRFHLVASRL